MISLNMKRWKNHNNILLVLRKPVRLNVCDLQAAKQQRSHPGPFSREEGCLPARASRSSPRHCWYTSRASWFSPLSSCSRSRTLSRTLAPSTDMNASMHCRAKSENNRSIRSEITSPGLLNSWSTFVVSMPGYQNTLVGISTKTLVGLGDMEHCPAGTRRADWVMNPGKEPLVAEEASGQLLLSLCWIRGPPPAAENTAQTMMLPPPPFTHFFTHVGFRFPPVCHFNGFVML